MFISPGIEHATPHRLQLYCNAGRASQSRILGVPLTSALRTLLASESIRDGGRRWRQKTLRFPPHPTTSAMSDNAWEVIFTNPANRYVSLVSTPLFLYDFLLTFGDEIRYIWRGRFSGATLLFVVNRYSTLLACAVNAFGLAKCHFVYDVGWWADASVEKCEIQIRLVDICTTIAYCAFAGFAALRVYALYGLRKRAFWIILAMGLITPATHMLIIITYEIRHVTIAPGLSGCFRDSKLEPLIPLTLVTSWKDPILWERIYMVMYETVLVVLTWYKTLGHSTLHASLAKTPMMTLLRRDGAHYFVLLVTATTLNVLGLMLPREATSPLNCMATLVDTLASMCMSYFILNLRSVDKQRTYGTETLATACDTSMRFVDAGAIVGNLGEPLRDDEEGYGDDSGEVDEAWDGASSRHSHFLGQCAFQNTCDTDEGCIC